MNAILVDDEERGIYALQELLNKYCTEVSIIGSATDIFTAAALIKKHKPDVVFLDIAMPGGNGFQLLDMFDVIEFEIIFVTAYQEYAIKALKLSALDYLLKPVNISELQMAVKKLINKRKGSDNIGLQYFKDNLNKSLPFNKIVISDASGHHFLDINDIVYCEADENYTHFFLLNNRKYTASKALKDYEELFMQHHFFRSHKSYLVNLSHVVAVNKDFLIITSNGSELPLSFRKRGEFFNLLKDMHLM